VRLIRLPDETWKKYDLSSLRFVASTGAPCAPEVKRAIIARLGPVVHETYASTEAGLITLATSADALARPGTAGRPAGGAELRILAEDGRACAPGEIGVIYARQPAYPDFTYQNAPEARRAIDRDGLITLGDMGYLDRDGYLFVCDRAADMVISGGVNIYPAEIEHALLRPRRPGLRGGRAPGPGVRRAAPRGAAAGRRRGPRRRRHPGRAAHRAGRLQGPAVVHDHRGAPARRQRQGRETPAPSGAPRGRDFRKERRTRSERRFF
jgi:acyl-CoA synthetase (AMP-forming)/AMP-acid ligase II